MRIAKKKKEFRMITDSFRRKHSEKHTRSNMFLAIMLESLGGTGKVKGAIKKEENMKKQRKHSRCMNILGVFLLGKKQKRTTIVCVRVFSPQTGPRYVILSHLFRAH